ncbi:MAG TPA: hypothetical protein VF011_21275 [Terriglobales bacterium]
MLYRNIGIRNGCIVGFENGTDPEGSGTLIEAIHARWNANDGIIVAGGGTVRLSSANQNGFYGIYISGGGIAERNTAIDNENGMGVFSGGSVVGNVLSNNLYGLLASDAVYGSNSLLNNTNDFYDGGGNVSQNNNNCNGHVC